jgi:hypothetical protein
MADDYTDAGLAAGLPPNLAKFVPRIVQIESGGNPSAKTGKYTGILQMGPDERAQYGGDSLAAGTKLLKTRADEFEKANGRPPTATELYLAHQQGGGGLAAHMRNPDAPAWQNMASTPEGQAKGDKWAKQAIWGNVPDDVKAKYPGGVDNLTSSQFMDIWRNKVEGPGAQPAPQAINSAGAAQMSVPPTAAAGTPAPDDAALAASAATAAGPNYNKLLSGIPGVMAKLQQSTPAPANFLAPINFPVPAGIARQRMIAATGAAPNPLAGIPGGTVQ